MYDVTVYAYYYIIVLEMIGQNWSVTGSRCYFIKHMSNSDYFALLC
jgi:hypothetical protein